jgi:hypothetical protein
MYRGVEVQIHICLTSALFASVLSASQPAPLLPGKGSEYSLNRRLGGPPSRPERYGKVKILDPTETRTPASESPNPYPLAISTELPRLH